MIVVSAFVQQKLRRAAHVHNDDINTAVVVEVSKCSPSARCVWNSSKDARNVFKCSITLVSEDLHRFSIACGAGNLVHLRLDMAVGLKEVQPAAIAKIHE